MKVWNKTGFLVLMLSISLVSILIVARPVPANTGPVWFLVWQSEVSSSGAEVVSSVLENGSLHRIVVQEIWWYNNDSNLAADAQYYTTDGSDSWEWVNNFTPADNHSFLQIDGNDVYWGPFDNGRPDGTGHTYTIMGTGNGTALTFRIFDWVDLDTENNSCHLTVRIYRVITVGGYITDPAPNISLMWVVGTLVLGLAIMVPIISYRRKLTRWAQGV